MVTRLTLSRDASPVKCTLWQQEFHITSFKSIFRLSSYVFAIDLNATRAEIR